MADASSGTGRKGDAIASRIGTLATDLMVRGIAGSDTGAALLAISEEAAAEGGSEVAALARTLSGRARAGDTEAVTAGLAQLQAALERWQQAASAAPGAIAWDLDPAPLAQDAELVNDFIMESREHLDSVEGRLLEIERDPKNKEAIHSIFRSFHTVKGLAGFLELGAVRDVAHEVETVLDQVREGQLAMTGDVVDIVLASLDYLNGCIRALESEGPASPGVAADNAALLLRVRRVAEGSAAAQEPAIVPEADVATAAPETGTDAARPATDPPGHGRTRARAVKIDTEKLDYLVDMVGEMVIAQSLIRYDPDLKLERQPRLSRNLSQLSRITDEVQRTAMSMRMVPIGGVFQKMARLVRDLSRKFGKQVEFESVGDDVELDRNIVEELSDPLMHMVRNAVDHGVEAAGEREAAGKDPTAKVFLRAMHQAGQIVIEIGDDGRGLDREKLLAKARKQGLTTAGSEMSDNEVFNLIFAPGFSTAEQLSEVSGRGVGMDVVRRQILKLRGSIDIHSRLGHGTTFALKLPLTLAIIDGLVVTVGEDRYVLPIFSVRELLRPGEDKLFTVENRSEMVLIRERLVPVVRLYERFGVTPRTTSAQQSVLVLAECDNRSFCIMVDGVLGKQEIVIKSLGPMFHKVPGVAGGAILGDGHVALILDPAALFGAGAEN